MSHPFSFSGGEELSSIGATWFVSYMYYLKFDHSHKNWTRVKTYKKRIAIFNTTTHYHKFWLQEVLKMDDKRLNTNKIGVKAEDTKIMVSKLM